MKKKSKSLNKILPQASQEHKSTSWEFLNALNSTVWRQNTAHLLEKVKAVLDLQQQMLILGNGEVSNQLAKLPLQKAEKESELGLGHGGAHL